MLAEKDLGERLVKWVTLQSGIRKSIKALHETTRGACDVSNATATKLMGVDDVPEIRFAVTDVAFGEHQQVGGSRLEGFWSVDLASDRIARFTCFVDEETVLRCEIVAGQNKTTLLCKHGAWFRPGDAESKWQSIDVLQTIRGVLHDAIEARCVAMGGQ